MYFWWDFWHLGIVRLDPCDMNAPRITAAKKTPARQASLKSVLAASGQAARDETPNLKGRGVKFDNTLNLGHVITLMVTAAAMVTGWADLRASDRENSTAISVVESRQKESNQQISKSLEDIKDTQKETARLLQTLQTDVGVLRGRAAAGDSPSRPSGR